MCIRDRRTPPVSAPVQWIMQRHRLPTLPNGCPNTASTSADISFTNKCISDTTESHHQGEVDIAASPIDHSRLIAVWHNFIPLSEYESTIKFEYAITTDCGLNWWRNSLYHPAFPDTENYFIGDPSVAVDNAGNVFISAIGFNYDLTESEVFVYASRDSGRTFTELCTVAIDFSGNFHDKEWVEADWSGSFPGNVYIVWQMFDLYWETYIMFSRSTDFGHTFEEPAVIDSSYDETDSPGIPYCAVGPDGELYVCWVRWGYPTSLVCCVRSDDGGNTFTDRFYVVSTEIIADSLGRYARANGFPIVAVDGTTAERRGWVYIVYASWEGDGNRADVFCVHSADRGSTWSEPVLVNDIREGDQFMPWVDVDDEGNVNIICLLYTSPSPRD